MPLRWSLLWEEKLRERAPLSSRELNCSITSCPASGRCQKLRVRDLGQNRLGRQPRNTSAVLLAGFFRLFTRHFDRFGRPVRANRGCFGGSFLRYPVRAVCL